MNALSTEEAMYSCVRCGACRDACPTLDITGKEADGPRGRVIMSRSLMEGMIPANDEIQQQLDRCLLCSACVDACPIDVPVPDIVMMAKEKINESRKKVTGEERLRGFVLKNVVPNQKLLHIIGHLLWLYQKIGLRWLTRRMRVMKWLPSSMSQMEAVIPDILPPQERKPLSQLVKPIGTDVQTAKVAMFHGCIMDVLFRQTNVNSIHLLAKSGYEVKIPSAQGCCGALHSHNGQKKSARELAKKNIEAFEQEDIDYIVSNAGGCGAMLREYEMLFDDDPEWRKRAEKFSAKVKDISEVIVESGKLPESKGQGERITYQPSCHLQYVMKVKDAPKKLLKMVQNSEYVELPQSKLCCGSAGIYNMLQPEMANDILDKKMNHVKSTQSSVIITANPGCLLQLKAGIEREGLQESMQAVHIVDYLFERIGKE